MTKTFKLTDGMQSKNLEKAALAYAEWGLPILPVFGIGKDGKCLCGNSKCKRQGKHPMTKHSFKDATTNLEQIKKWWKQHPNANIGSPLVEGLFALDFDGKTGKKTCQHLGLDKFETLRVETGKGFHLYVHADLKAQNDFLPRLDIRGGGKGFYIVLPPSHHKSGKRYQWKD